MLTTGMLMFGKMSVGVRKMDSVPRIKIRIASTTNVYRRFSATLNIHMIHRLHLSVRRSQTAFNQIDFRACASEFCYPESRSVARPLQARELFRTEQFPWR